MHLLRDTSHPLFLESLHCSVSIVVTALSARKLLSCSNKQYKYKKHLFLGSPRIDFFATHTIMHTRGTVTVNWSVFVRSKVTGGFTGRPLFHRRRLVQTLLFKQCRVEAVADG